MSWLAGVDGCPAGWVVALRQAGSSEFVLRVVGSISEVWGGDVRPRVVGIDIPIGLFDEALPGGRECDKKARKLLGEPRARSVFSPPARPALRARTYREAVRLNRASSSHGIGMSRQTYGILPKIRQVDELVTPRRQRSLVEVHPELVFRELNDRRALVEPKKSAAGLRRRIRLLERRYGRGVAKLVEEHRSSRVARDDIVDAMAACWTAERVLEEKEFRLPSKPPRDARGLRMEIVT